MQRVPDMTYSNVSTLKCQTMRGNTSEEPREDDRPTTGAVRVQL